MALGSRIVYFVFLGFASLLVVAANLGYQSTWYSVANTVFSWVSPTPYIQAYALDVLILGTAYLFAFLSVSGIKREGRQEERDRWAEKLAG